MGSEMCIRDRCKGSYRAEDMVELLDKTLSVAEADGESIVVCLDWSVTHRDPAVVELIESKGHVLLLHGGGTTRYEQVIDTHLHSTLQARMKELEIAVFYGQLSDISADGTIKACSRSRHDLCMLVKAVWQSLNHAAISHTGYQQTGPLLPFTGPILMNDVCRDLREVYRDQDPHDDPNHIGTKIREEARQLVEREWNEGHVSSWGDYRLVVEDHRAHRAQDEGEEAMPF